MHTNPKTTVAAVLEHLKTEHEKVSADVRRDDDEIHRIADLIENQKLLGADLASIAKLHAKTSEVRKRRAANVAHIDALERRMQDEDTIAVEVDRFNVLSDRTSDPRGAVEALANEAMTALLPSLRQLVAPLKNFDAAFGELRGMLAERKALGPKVAVSETAPAMNFGRDVFLMLAVVETSNETGITLGDLASTLERLAIILCKRAPRGLAVALGADEATARLAKERFKLTPERIIEEARTETLGATVRALLADEQARGKAFTSRVEAEERARVEAATKIHRAGFAVAGDAVAFVPSGGRQ